MRKAPVAKCVVLAFLLLNTRLSGAGPIDVALNPAPQAFTSSCQSYAMALALSFHPASPFRADTPKELRELELRIRAHAETAAKVAGHLDENGKPNPTHDDLRSAFSSVVNNLKLTPKSFASLNDAIQFISKTTEVSNVDGLPTSINIGLVKTPVLMSFQTIEASDYRGKKGTGSHIVTVFGVQAPLASINDDARPKLLLVNSAVKYPGGQKNACEATDLPGDVRYSAVASRTSNYLPMRYSGKHPYILHIIENK